MAEQEEKKKKETTRCPSAKKRDRQSQEQTLNNQMFKSRVKTAVRQLKEAVEKKEPSLVSQKLNTVYSLMDKGVKRGIFKPNKANRCKSRLSAKIS